MQHLRWEKSGRIFSHADEGKPNTFTWKSSIGQNNVNLGAGKFAPYIWDKTNRIVKFGECELRFTASGLEFWHGIEKLNTLSFNPEWKQGANWRRRVPSVGSLSIVEIDPGNSKVELKIFYKITTQDSETEVFVRVGYNHKVHFGTRFKALIAGVEQRITLEFAELFIPVEERDRLGNILPTARLKTDKSWVAVSRDELPDHEFDYITNLKIGIGRKVYTLGEEKIVSPTTWGTDVGIAAGLDDGHDWYPTESYSGTETLLYTGKISATEHYDANFRWTGLSTIPKGSTIDSGLLDLYLSDNYANTTTIYGWDADEAPRCDTTHRPADQTRTTASVVFAPAGTNWKTADVKGIVQEIITSYATDTINFLAIGTAGTPTAYYEIQAYENAGTNEAELTITYTAGGGGLSIVDDSRGMLRGEMRGMNRGMSRIN